MKTLSRCSDQRVKRFVHDFIRSDYVANFMAERNSDHISHSDRANRVAEHAEFGGDGRTHAEVIGDWRDAFDCLMRDRRSWSLPERFMDAVNADFDATEDWHRQNGTLFEIIG